MRKLVNNLWRYRGGFVVRAYGPDHEATAECTQSLFDHPLAEGQEKNEVLGTWSLVMVVLGLLPLIHLLVDMLNSFGFCGRNGLAKLRLVEQGLITL